VRGKGGAVVDELRTFLGTEAIDRDWQPGVCTRKRTVLTGSGPLARAWFYFAFLDSCFDGFKRMWLFGVAAIRITRFWSLSVDREMFSNW
jgi:hypothetical protein